MPLVLICAGLYNTRMPKIFRMKRKRMNRVGYVLHRRALIGFNTFTADERGHLDRAVAPLLDLPEERWSDVGARRLGRDESVYLVQVDDNWRAFVQPTTCGPEVVDLVRKETLQAFATNGA